MSKKEILQALAHQQQQDSVAMNRFLIALAQAANVKPEEFAKHFMDGEASREYADKLNIAIDDLARAEREKQAKDKPADETPESVS